MGASYLPYVLAAVSLICLIIIIVLIAKSCGSSKTKETEAPVTDTSITDVTDVTETTPVETTETTPDPTAPIGIYTFSNKTGCRTWWDLFKNVYNIEIESESDAYVTTILTYNNLDASYKPKEGEPVKLPPATLFPPRQTTV